MLIFVHANSGRQDKTKADKNEMRAENEIYRQQFTIAIKKKEEIKRIGIIGGLEKMEMNNKKLMKIFISRKIIETVGCHT